MKAEDLEALIRALPEVASKNKTVVSATVSAVRTFHEILVKKCDTRWLENQLALWKARRESRSPAVPALAPSSGVPWRNHDVFASQTRGLGDSSWTAEQRRGSKPAGLDGCIRSERFVVGFLERNRPMFCDVWWPAQLTPEQLEAVGFQILDLARREQGQPAGDPLIPAAFGHPCAPPPTAMNDHEGVSVRHHSGTAVDSQPVGADASSVSD
jgi:hypothetical protein